MLSRIIEAYPEETFLKADGLDDAIIGVDEESLRLIYSVTKCIEVFMKDAMTEEEAAEYFDFNVKGSYMGDETPIWCEDRL